MALDVAQSGSRPQINVADTVLYTPPHLLGLPLRSPDNSSLQEEIPGSLIPGVSLVRNVEELMLQE